VGAVTALFTYFLVWGYSGELKVVLPDRVGLEYETMPDGQPSPDRLKMLLPITFTNTGASHTRRHIINVSASLLPADPPPPPSKNPIFTWEWEIRFISTDEWLLKHRGKDENPVNQNLAARSNNRTQERAAAAIPSPDAPERVEDQRDYVTRAFAFPLSGGESVSKVLDMFQLDGTMSGRKLENFKLVVEVKLEDETITEERNYQCLSPVPSKIFNWCREKK
jgi:hypothetical protein